MEVTWINPDELEHWAKSPFIQQLLVRLRERRSRKYAAYVVGGDWDKDLLALSDMDSHHAFYQRFSGQARWRDTDYFKRIMKVYAAGGTKGTSPTIEDWEERILNKYDGLYRSIRMDGFKTQEMIGGQFGSADEIAVCIDRNGKYLFVNGKHRLAIAKALGLDTIPVVVIAVHRSWCDRMNDAVSSGDC